VSLEYIPGSFLNVSESQMANGELRHTYRFKAFRLDTAERQLTHDGAPVPLTPKAFDVLVTLVERNGHLVGKDELMRTVWADSIVEEANIARIVHTLRRVLGEDENGNKYIETVARKGYRFVAKVDEADEQAAQKSITPEVQSSTAAEIINQPEFETAPSSTHVTTLPPVIERTHRNRMFLFTAGFLIAVFLIFLLSFPDGSAPSARPNGVISIAILPFKPLASENRDSLFELGIADSLILKLSTAKGLFVRPMSAIRRYAEVEQDAVDAGREQKVGYVVASNYQIDKGKIRVTSQLFNVSNSVVEQVFKDVQESSNSFEVQDKVAESIGSAILKHLNLESNSIAAKRGTTNDQAYRLYSRGSFLADKRSPKDAPKAVEDLEQAVKLDPNYARAYSGLANAYMAVGLLGGDLHLQYPKAKAAIETALAIDDNLAEAHSYSGEIKAVYEHDYAGAEAQHKRALQLDANSSAAHRMYALLLVPLGRFDEAIDHLKKAIDLEPALGLNHRALGQTFFVARRYPDAIATLKDTIVRGVNVGQAYSLLVHTYRQKGDNAEAFETFVQWQIQRKEKPEDIEVWKTIYAKSGWRGIIERQLEKVKEDERNGNPRNLTTADYLIDLGRHDEAFAYLEKAYLERGYFITTLKVNPQYDPLRSHPRFEALLRRLRLK
jgi:DNA-binding winged helix-turn-helix (wHTH) protein/tetratricopeptide (TPR) repeat protein